MMNKENLKKCMKRALRGEGVTLGFLGGSITQGSLSSTPETCYAYLVYQWWEKRFPKTEFKYINAGIGGTTSQFGVARVQQDLLIGQPDFVVVDFTVNDDDSLFFMETYEGLIRTLLSYDDELAVLALCNIYYDTGISAIKQHEKVLEHYQIPMVSMNDLYQSICDGNVRIDQITSDGLHPNDVGHQIVANEIISFLEDALDEVKQGREVSDKKCNWVLPFPLTQNSYEHSKRFQNQDGIATCQGFVEDLTSKEGLTDVFKDGWIGRCVGDKITLQLKGSCLALQYRKTIHHPAPVAQVVVDGNLEHVILLDANFEETWGDSLAITTILHHGTSKVHQVEIQITEGVHENQSPFYLVSAICS